MHAQKNLYFASSTLHIEKQPKKQVKTVQKINVDM
jgi:hypothetical protein